MAEVWRKVPACRWFGIKAGVFEASSEGRARVGGSVRVLSPDKDGYLRFKYRGRWFYAHVLVCLAFHGKPEVRHLSGNRQVNKPAELAWGSRIENEREKERGDGRGSYPPVPSVTAVTSGLQER
jgi:hypothetical protein